VTDSASGYLRLKSNLIRKEVWMPFRLSSNGDALLQGRLNTTGYADSKTWRARSPDVYLVVWAVNRVSLRFLSVITVSRFILVSVGIIKTQRTSLSGLYCSLFVMLNWARPAETNRTDVHIKCYCQIQSFSVQDISRDRRLILLQTARLLKIGRRRERSQTREPAVSDSWTPRPNQTQHRII
jgi:hypothetical protein